MPSRGRPKDNKRVTKMVTKSRSSGGSSKDVIKIVKDKKTGETKKTVQKVKVKGGGNVIKSKKVKRGSAVSKKKEVNTVTGKRLYQRTNRKGKTNIAGYVTETNKKGKKKKRLVASRKGVVKSEKK